MWLSLKQSIVLSGGEGMVSATPPIPKRKNPNSYTPSKWSQLHRLFAKEKIPPNKDPQKHSAYTQVDNVAYIVFLPRFISGY